MVGEDSFSFKLSLKDSKLLQLELLAQIFQQVGQLLLVLDQKDPICRKEL